MLYYSASKVSKSASCQDRTWKIVVRTEEERRRIIESCHSRMTGTSTLMVFCLVTERLFKSQPFQSRYLGPYEITEDLGKGVVRLRNPATGLLLKKVVNACRLKPYCKKKQPRSPLHLSNSSLFQVRSFL